MIQKYEYDSLTQKNYSEITRIKFNIRLVEGLDPEDEKLQRAAVESHVTVS